MMSEVAANGQFSGPIDILVPFNYGDRIFGHYGRVDPYEQTHLTNHVRPDGARCNRLNGP